MKLYSLPAACSAGKLLRALFDMSQSSAGCTAVSRGECSNNSATDHDQIRVQEGQQQGCEQHITDNCTAFSRSMYSNLYSDRTVTDHAQVRSQESKQQDCGWRLRECRCEADLLQDSVIAESAGRQLLRTHHLQVHSCLCPHPVCHIQPEK